MVQYKFMSRARTPRRSSAKRITGRKTIEKTTRKKPARIFRKQVRRIHR